MATKTKRQELFLDSNHPNYAELINAGLTERDTCEFYLTSDGKSIAFNFDSLDTFMTYLSKLQGSRVECKLDASNVLGWKCTSLGWKYTDSYCLDNRPDGEGWVKFDVLTYSDELRNMIPPDNATEREHLLNCTYTVVRHAYNHKHMDLFFRFAGSQFQIEPVDRNPMVLGNYFMGIVFNLTDVKP
jgi:hypothetical protein